MRSTLSSSITARSAIAGSLLIVLTVSCINSGGGESRGEGSSERTIGTGLPSLNPTGKQVDPSGKSESGQSSSASGGRHKHVIGWPGIGIISNSAPPASTSAEPSPAPSPADPQTAIPSESATQPNSNLIADSEDWWYGWLTHSKCSQVTYSGADEAEALLVSGLRAICPISTPEGVADWSVAVSSYDSLNHSGGAPNGECRNKVGYSLLQTVVEFHKRYPDSEYSISSSGPGGGRCSG